MRNFACRHPVAAGRNAFLTIALLAGIPASAGPVDSAHIDVEFERILSDHRVTTIGAAVIENGELVWTGYYGERVPGEPANAKTMFNVGSVTKVVTAELALRLASEDVISLDEPMSEYWVDPDLVDEPRHEAD